MMLKERKKERRRPEAWFKEGYDAAGGAQKVPGSISGMAVNSQAGGQASSAMQCAGGGLRGVWHSPLGVHVGGLQQGMGVRTVGSEQEAGGGR